MRSGGAAALQRSVCTCGALCTVALHTSEDSLGLQAPLPAVSSCSPAQNTALELGQCSALAASRRPSVTCHTWNDCCISGSCDFSVKFKETKPNVGCMNLTEPSATTPMTHLSHAQCSFPAQGTRSSFQYNSHYRFPSESAPTDLSAAQIEIPSFPLPQPLARGAGTLKSI